MFWPDIFLSLREAKQRSNLMHSKEKYVWAQVRILHETEKAVLVDNGMKIWVPKSQTRGIKLRSNIFEVYVKESTVG